MKKLVTSEKQYLDLLKDIKKNGYVKHTRQGTDAATVFGRQMRFDLNEGFPLLTTKKLFMRGIIHELLWFLKGDSNIEYLVKNNVHIWDEWPYRNYVQQKEKRIVGPEETYSPQWREGMRAFTDRIANDPKFAKKWGELGPVYGYQWRHWPDGKGGEIDQIQQVVDTLKANPDSRRILVSAWNVADIKEMAVAGLPPCHSLFQFQVINGRLNCQLYQRSADYFLGVPFNIASYALLTMMVAQVTGLKLGEFIHTLGDTHLFVNHFDQAKLQLSRELRPLPKMKINPKVKSIFDFSIEDFTLDDYDPHPAIKAPIAV